MIVTSERTVLTAIKTDARTGRPTVIKLLAASALGASPRPSIRPATINTKTGIMIVPNAPRGSRRNILSSIQVNFQSPRSIIFCVLVANRVASQFDKDVFKVRENGAEIRDPDPILGETMNHRGDQILASAPKCELQVAANYRLDLRDHLKALFSRPIIRGKNDGSFRAVPIHKVLRSIYINDAPIFDDGYSIAQSFCFLHEMSRQKNSFAALANAAHEAPNRAPRLRVQPRGQFVEKHHLRIVDQRKRNEQSLLLSSGEGHEPSIPLLD